MAPALLCPPLMRSRIGLRARLPARPRLDWPDLASKRAVESRTRLEVWRRISADSSTGGGPADDGAAFSPSWIGGLPADRRRDAAALYEAELTYQRQLLASARSALPPEVADTVEQELSDAIGEARDTLEGVAGRLQDSMARAARQIGLSSAWSGWGHPGPVAALAGQNRVAGLLDALDSLLNPETGTSLGDTIDVLVFALLAEPEEMSEDLTEDLERFVVEVGDREGPLSRVSERGPFRGESGSTPSALLP